MKRTHAGTDAGQWLKTYSDAAGRLTSQSRADGATSEFFYNSFGQLRKQRDFDGRVILYAYNDRGELEYTAIDANDSDSIDLDGIDRVSRTTREVVDGRWRTRTEVWPTAGVNKPALASMRQAAPDSLFESTETFGVTTSRQTERLGDGIVRVTEQTADGATSVYYLLQGQ